MSKKMAVSVAFTFCLKCSNERKMWLHRTSKLTCATDDQEE